MPIFYSLSSPPSADRHKTDLHVSDVTSSWSKAPTETFMTRPAMLKTHADSILKPRLR